LPYELVYIVRPTVDEQALAAVNERVDKFVANNGGEIKRRDDWGKRRLAYPISKFTEGFYSVLQLNLPPTAVRELERSLKLTEEVLRYLVVRLDGE
jgi:small subunit ribosomal protein S6